MDKVLHLKYWLGLIAIILVSPLVFSQIIYTNPITGTNPNTANPYITGQTFDSKITVSGISRGSGIGSANANDRYNADGWGLLFGTNDYFEFTLTPNIDYKIDFSSLDFTVQSSFLTGPPLINLRSSLSGFATNIIASINLLTFGAPVSYSIDLSAGIYQNITSPITFRIYAWGALGGDFSINDFTFNGAVSCAATSTWSAGSWSNGLPSMSTHAIIADDYNTGVGGTQTSFSACALTVNSGYTLTVADFTYLELQNDVEVMGTGAIAVETHGAFVQNDDSSTFTASNPLNCYVRKSTNVLNNWYNYTYWSSPVSGLTIGTSPLADSNRRYWYNAINFEDVLTEIGNTNTFIAGSDDIDDDENDWQFAGTSYPMTPGVGIAATHSQIGYIGAISYNYDFYGAFNNGIITAPIFYNGANGDNDWNLIGNPYPCALDFNAFHALNSGVVGGAAYLWSHRTQPSGTTSGNETLNFSQSDYAIITAGSGSINNFDNGDGNIPTDYIPSGQGFFISGVANGSATFNNSMRMADGTSNSQFFKSSHSKNTSLENKLWLNLTTDNGVFNQTLIAYVDGATNGNDGSAFDATRNFSSGIASMIYTFIDGENDKKYAIQGKAQNMISLNETIPLGFYSSIAAPTLYKLDLAYIKGDFLTNNSVYLKDNLLNTIHNLSDADYSFTSEIGEFNDRFVVMFNNQSLSTHELLADANMFKIIDLQNDQVKFTTSNSLKIKAISIFDLLGRTLYKFKGQNSEETYNLASLKNTIYVAKVELSNGAIISKKAIKK